MLGALRRGLCAAVQRAAADPQLLLPGSASGVFATATATPAFRHAPCSTSLPFIAAFSSPAASAAAISPSAPSPTTTPSTPTTATATTGRPRPARNLVFYPYVTQYHKDATVPVYNLDKQVVGSYTLPGAVFGLSVRIDILHRVVRWQRAKRQQGTHKAKDRSEVRGGGRKPRPQKGSGRSRQGSIRAPQWRGGGIVHGPIPRSHAHDLPRKVRRLGLKCALSAKAHEQRLLIVDTLAPAEPRTRLVRQHLGRLLADAPRLSVLLVDAAVDSAADGGRDLRTAARNIPGVEIVPAIGANVYSLLKRDFAVITKTAADLLVQRLTAPINRLGASGRARAAIATATTKGS